MIFKKPTLFLFGKIYTNWFTCLDLFDPKNLGILAKINDRSNKMLFFFYVFLMLSLYFIMKTCLYAMKFLLKGGASTSGVICRPKSELIFYCQSAQISLHKSQIELLQNITLLCHNFTCHESHIFCLIVLFLSRCLVSMFKCYRRRFATKWVTS